MTSTLAHPTTASTAVPGANARGEAVFLRAQDYTLTARQLVFVLAAHLARHGDTLGVRVVDPLAAIDAHMRFDTGASGDLTGWTSGRTPADVAMVLARAEQIARDYFGSHFPPIPW